ncbi:MAG: glycosyl hydrolase [Acidobacteriota bacterium]
MKKLNRVLTVGVAAVLAAAGWLLSPGVAAQGNAVDPSLYSGMRWRSIGPDRGGRSIAVAGSAARPNEYYFGAVGGGVWKTTDFGHTWTPVTDAHLESSSVGALAVAESNPDIVYAGMGEACFRGNIIQGDGIYKTTDGGKTWAHVGLRDSQIVSKIRVHPSNPDLVYAAVLGHAYDDNDERGVFRSRDGGKNWERVLFRDAKTGAVDLSMDPKNPDVLYAALWQVYRTPWSMESGGPGSGLFKTTDGGTTWTELTKAPGMPDGLWGKVGVSVSPVDGNRVYAIIENENGGVFVSDDAGATWRRTNEDRNLRQRAFYYTHITADTQDKDTVYVLNVQFFKSTDGGKTFPTQIRVPHGDNHDLWIAPNDNKRMVQANDGGGNVSVNGGQTWSGQGYATGQFYNVFTTRHVPYHVCGAQQDNSTACISSQAQAGAGEGSLPPLFYAVGGGESGYIAPDPTDLDVFYAGSYGGLMTRLDRAVGQARVVTIYPDNPMGWSSIDIKERFQWTYPIVFSRVNPKVLYAASQSLWRTTNGGQSWQKISPNLARSDPKTMGPSGGPITRDQTGVETYAVIFTVAPSYQDEQTIWTGSDDGWVHVTRDGGGNWERVTPPDLPEFARISLIEASPHQNGVAYLAANRYQQGDRRPYFYKTADFGKSWSKIVTGIPAHDFARVIREDPKRRGLLYAGTEHGVYVSFNDGASWQSLRLNLPVTPVHGIVVEDRDLVIGTHGRGFYILDDIGVLRQATSIATSGLHIFEPVNPQRGLDRELAVDYYLAKEAEQVTIEILDSSGAVLRAFRGTPKDPEPAAGGGGGFFGFRPPRVGVKQGMNRFNWDLRQEGAVVFPGMIMWAAQPQRGPASPPGQYSVRITANGETKTRPFTIGLDPRLVARGVTEADLHEQYRLSVQVRDRVSEANRAVIRIRAIREQVDDRLKKVPERRRAEVQKLADALMKPLATVEEAVYQVRNRSSQDPLNYPIRLNNKIAALAGVIEGADYKPTDQTYEVFKDLSAQLQQELDAMTTAIARELPRLNAALRREKVDAVDPKQ